MSSLIDTISLMRESIHATSGAPPEKLHLGSKVWTALRADPDSVGLLRYTPVDLAPASIFGMEIVHVSNDPYALAIVGHQVQQDLPL